MPSCNENNCVRVAGLRQGSRNISQGNPRKSQSIKSIRLTAFLKHFLCSFILDPGVIMSGSFSQGLRDNKTTFYPNFLSWKALVSSNACLLFISSSQAAQGPFGMSLFLATGVLWLQELSISRPPSFWLQGAQGQLSEEATLAILNALTKSWFLTSKSSKQMHLRLWGWWEIPNKQKGENDLCSLKKIFLR